MGFFKEKIAEKKYQKADEKLDKQIEKHNQQNRQFERAQNLQDKRDMLEGLTNQVCEWCGTLKQYSRVYKCEKTNAEKPFYFFCSLKCFYEYSDRLPLNAGTLNFLKTVKNS